MPLSPIIRLGTRGSLLARTQSQQVADLLAPHLPPAHTIELVLITTSGDKQQTSRLQDSGGKGLFTKELDEALLAGSIDFAVHSAKDLPADRPSQLTIACTPQRADPRDVFIGKDATTFDQLPQGAMVGTASLRRQAQLLSFRPDLRVIPLRGNIDTRLRKVAEGFDNIQGTFLAAAGLLRANLLPAHAQFLPTDKFIPAAGQGTLALETRVDNTEILALLQNIHHSPTAACLAFERSIVHALAGSCTAPIGVFATPRESDPGYLVRAIVAHPTGRPVSRAALMATDSGESALHALRPLLLQTLHNRGAAGILAQV